MAVLTAGLQNLRRQVDEAFPGRDRASDGWIGDAAHQAGTSGHNPDDTRGSKAAWDGDPDNLAEVRAWDMDSDLGDGLDAQDYVDHVRRLPGVGAVLRYIIFDRKIYHSNVGFAPAWYTGSSPHTEHVHHEGVWTQVADNNTSFDYYLEEIPVALTPADKTWLRQTIEAAVDARVGDVVQRYDAAGVLLPASDPNPRMTVASALQYLGKDSALIKERLDVIHAVVSAGTATIR